MEKIQFASDLHLENHENLKYLTAHPLKKSADILVIAGDTAPFSLYSKLPFFQWCSETYKQTFVVPGNHEYYGSRCVEQTYSLNEKLFPNVTLVNNQTITINKTDFFFTTLWSDLDVGHESAIQKKLADFKYVKWFSDPAVDNVPYRDAFKYCRRWLEDSLQKSVSEYKVVVTHHCPVLSLTVYGNDFMDSCFNVDMTPLMDKYNITYWIYGHTHSNFNDYKHGNCTVVSNQLGFIVLQEHGDFLQTKCIPSSKQSSCVLV
ncbi:hypothetical protein EIN_221970 [Entamoeba invadens IP1]|uniref:Calcineurin-like phosphoesterase domain-containing protein n=1 Tax=Entamoeba invadens IP1 TaxID=370355 RepID=A0A0A1U225_ENTIV|nr:hypothetical protein EIN_221970 [Entamoeba invadens IP1]ELP88064.1 hypothetical protein EIN_221970 [Entamoeba invadens IP1]|eukprot:XP_004254835.1 hypothetical protein EIN_221970 [Entamoeba invadens IP1]